MSDDTKTNGIKDLLATAGISNADKPTDNPFDIYNQHHLKIDNEVADLMHEFLTLRHFLTSMQDAFGIEIPPAPEFDELSREEFAKLLKTNKLKDYQDNFKLRIENHLKALKESPSKERAYIREKFNRFDQLKYHRRWHRWKEIQDTFRSWGMHYIEILLMNRDDLPAYKREFNILNDACSEIEFQSKIYTLDTPTQMNCVKFLYNKHKMNEVPVSSQELQYHLGIQYSPSRIFRRKKGYHPLWETLIIQPKQGCFQLNISAS